MSWPDLATLDASQAFWTIVVGAISNTCCAVLGCYLVLRRLSLLGDAISHAILPGIVVAFLLTGQTASWPMLLGAATVGVLTTVVTHALHASGNVPEDASMGVVFTSLFALGVVLIALAPSNVDLDLDCVLMGRLEEVTFPEPWLGFEVPLKFPSLLAVLGATAAFVALFWKELKIASFDPALATAMGISAAVVHYLLMGMVAVVTVAAFDAVGSVLVIAMLIVPAATAHLLTDRLGWMVGWAVVVAIISAVLGYLGDVYFDTGVAGMMAVGAGSQLLLAVFLAPRHGLLSKLWHRFMLALRIVSEDLLAVLYRFEEATSETRTAGVPWNLCRRVAGGGLAAWLAAPLLWWRGELRVAAGRLWLTQQGRRNAQSLVRSHRLWEVFLGEYFQLPLDHLHESAERIEHFIGPKLQERLASDLHQPGRDPHGKEIPVVKDADNDTSRGRE
ncbi:MAG TPA: metal ABC transporter permease [Pirellulales bacterium]|nr:metal ABC transporter permease [Pirellulales bacterium]